MSVHTLSTKTHAKPEGAALDSEQFSVQGGSSRPGLCESPAEAGSVNAHTSATAKSKFLKVVSPVEVVSGRGRFAAKTTHHTPETESDLVLFRSLADRKDFDSLTDLCRERLLTSRDGLTSLRWTKDRAIVEAMRGNHTGAYDLLASAHYLASETTGKPRGKYENEFGVVLARLGRSSLALERFNLGYQNSRAGLDFLNCARADHNRARVLVTRGEHAKAMRYITRALDYARGANDYRLEREVCDSLVEFEGALR